MRPFPHVVVISGDDSRRDMAKWCTEQFGPSEANMVYFNALGVALYEGTGQWSIAISKARFERVEHAIAFKIRWG